MKLTAVLGGLVVWLLAMPVQAQQGLKGEYYTGTNFDRKVFTRIDRQLNFNWAEQGPGPGMPPSYYSIRWTGKLLAPATGQYWFYAKVDDGIRVWVGNKKVMESWQLNDSEKFSGSIVLEAGKYYDLRVDYFNDMLEGELQLFWLRPDANKALPNQYNPITAQYFVQKAPPVAVVQKPAKPVAITPAVVPTPPKPLPQKRPVIINANPRQNPPSPKPTRDTNTVVAAAVPAKATPSPPADPKFELTKGATVVLRNVQFEQSSYVLLPESSAELNKVVEAMKANPQWHIDVAGHTDNVGDPRLNLALSENRAKVVATYLKRHGIADDRITATGFGGTRPIADNAIEAERSKNRRVEITIR